MAAGEDEGGVAVDGAFMASHPASLIALVGGAGLAPVAPGTFGALAGLPLGVALQQLPLPAALVLIALGFVSASGPAVSRRSGRASMTTAPSSMTRPGPWPRWWC